MSAGLNHKFPDEHSKTRALSLLLLIPAALAPLIYLVSLIASNYVTTPYADTWSLYHRILRFMNGDLSWGQFLFAQQVDSRPAIPRVLLFLAHSLNRNLLIDVVINFASAIGAAVVTLIILKKTNPGISWPVLLGVGALFNLNFFSLAQWINWNWHDAVLSFLPNLFFALGWWANLSSLRPLRRGLLVSFCCTLSSFSFVSGLFQWFVLVPVTIGLNRRERLRLWALHVCAALVCFTFYLSNYRPGKATSSFRESLFHPGRITEYIFIWLGSSLSGGSVTMAAIWGATLLLIFLFLSYQCVRIWRSEGLQVAWLPWLSMGCYALISGTIAALARSQIGLEQALHSRYCTYSQWLIIAIIGLSVTLLRQNWQGTWDRARIAPAILALLGASFIYFQARHSVVATEDWRKFTERMHFQKQSLGLEVKQPGQLWTFDHPNRKQVLKAYQLMQEAGFLRDVFHSDKILDLLAARKTSAPADGQLTMAAYLPSREVKCQGWSVGGGPAAGNRVLIVLISPRNNKVLAVADGPIDQPRGDVVRAKQASSTALAGFKLEFAIPKMPRGRYFLAAFRYGRDEREYYPVGVPRPMNISG